jgi:hypothetical protein
VSEIKEDTMCICVHARICGWVAWDFMARLLVQQHIAEGAEVDDRAGG